MHNWASGSCRAPGTPLVDEDTHRRLVADLTDPARVKVTSASSASTSAPASTCCGVCGATVRVSVAPARASAATAGSTPAPRTACVMRAGDPVDDYVENLVVERLSTAACPPADRRPRLRRGRAAGRPRRVGGQVRPAGGAAGRRHPGRAPGAREGRRVQGRDRRHRFSELAAAARTSPTAALLATGKELRKRWAALPPAVRSQIVDEVAVVTINPTRRGVRVFDPDAIDVQWKGGTA